MNTETKSMLKRFGHAAFVGLVVSGISLQSARADFPTCEQIQGVADESQCKDPVADKMREFAKEFRIFVGNLLSKRSEPAVNTSPAQNVDLSGEGAVRGPRVGKTDPVYDTGYRRGFKWELLGAVARRCNVQVDRTAERRETKAVADKLTGGEWDRFFGGYREGLTLGYDLGESYEGLCESYNQTSSKTDRGDGSDQ